MFRFKASIAATKDKKRFVFQNVKSLMHEWKVSTEYLASITDEPMHDEHTLKQITRAYD